MKIDSNYRLSLSLTALAIGIATLLPQTASAATLYSVLDLGNLSGSSGGSSYGTAINDLGQVVGTTTAANGRPQAFRTAPNSPINPLTDNIDTVVIGLADSSSSDINNSGQLVGTYRGRGGQRDIGYRTAPNGPIDNNSFISNRANGGLGNNDAVPFVLSASGINELGQVVGVGIVQSIQPSVVNYYGGVLVNNPNNSTEQVTQLGAGSEPEDINDVGQIVGTFESHAFRTAPNSAINKATDDLGTLGGLTSRGTDINNLGQVVGSSTTTSGELHAFRTAANQAINSATDDLGTLGGNFSVANSINELGQVVGISSLANGTASAFLYEEGTMFDLNDLIDTTVNLGLFQATGINESGQIVASNYSRAYLLTPVPEPTTMFGALAFGAGASFLRKRTKQKITA